MSCQTAKRRGQARGTASWFRAVAKLIDVLSACVLELSSPGPSGTCVVVRLMGLDGAIGMPEINLQHLERVKSERELDPVHQAYARWIPALVPHRHLVRAADRIRAELASSSPNSNVTICLHGRFYSCIEHAITEHRLNGSQLQVQHFSYG